MKTLEIQYLDVSMLKENLENPRTINKEKFDDLVKSVKEFPEMLSLRPIVVDTDMIIIGGNMRHKAYSSLGYEKIPVIVYSEEYHKKSKSSKTYNEARNEFIIKDNVGSGQWDWDILANEWTASELNEWGLGVWENKIDNDKEFKPVLFPQQSDKMVTEDDIEKASNNLGSNFNKGTTRKYIETMCSECGHEFNVEVE